MEEYKIDFIIELIRNEAERNSEIKHIIEELKALL